MQARRCTIDSSCVIALDHLELVPRLSVLFSIVLVHLLLDRQFALACLYYLTRRLICMGNDHTSLLTVLLVAAQAKPAGKEQQ